MMDSGSPQRIALALSTRGNDVAVIERHDGSFVFPGGKIESGETEAQAATRELLEETGLKATVAYRIGSRVHPTSGVETAYYFFPEPDGELKLREPDKHRHIFWTPFYALPQPMTVHLFRNAAILMSKLPDMIHFIPDEPNPLTPEAIAHGWRRIKNPFALSPTISS